MKQHNREVGSRLFYHGTNTEVDVGDRVEMKSCFRKKKLGTVCYIPGLVEPHPEMENETGKQWAIRSDDGTIYAMGYFPEIKKYGQPSKSLKFLGRGGNDKKIMPNEILDDTPNDDPITDSNPLEPPTA